MRRSEKGKLNSSPSNYTALFAPAVKFTLPPNRNAIALAHFIHPDLLVIIYCVCILATSQVTLPLALAQLSYNLTVSSIL